MPADPPSAPARSGPRPGHRSAARRLHRRPAWPELIIELQVRGGDVELVLAPGMVVDANELAVRFTRLAISRDAGDNTPETLHVRLAGRMKHGRIGTRWAAPHS